MFGELYAEELHRTLSHINCTPCICCVFWGIGGLQIQIDLLRNLGSKAAHGKLGDFLGCVGSRSTKTLENMSFGGMYMRGTICPFGFLSQMFFGVFHVKLDIFPLKRSVLEECRKGHDGGRKGQILNFGSKTLKQPKMLAKQGKTNKTTIGLITGIGLKVDQEWTCGQGKKRQKDKKNS